MRPALIAAATLALGAGLAILYVYDPTNAGFYPPCVFHALTGLHCPGCGAGRAMHRMLHGDFTAAFWLNPLLFMLLPLIAWLGAERFGLAPASRLSQSVALPLGLALAITAFWILRNLPFEPFIHLAP